MEAQTEAAAPVDYRPSGKVHPLIFPLLFIATCCVAIFMGGVLLYTSNYWYWFLVTPLLFSIPSVAMVFVTINYGKCRNPLLAMIIGLLGIFGFYLSYWLLFYADFLRGCGSEMAHAIIHDATGRSGFIGFVMLVCDSTSIETERYGSGVTTGGKAPYLLHGLEFLGALLMAFALPMHLSEDVYYEREKSWGRKHRFVLPIDHLEDLLLSIHQHDWSQFPREELSSPDGQISGPRVLFEINHLPGHPSAPVYVSVSALRAEAHPNAGELGLGSRKKKFFTYHAIPAPASSGLLALFANISGFKITQASEDELQQVDR